MSLCHFQPQFSPLCIDNCREMVDQVMAVHRTSQHLHIGCDEVFSLGECQECRALGLSNTRIFIEHVKFVAEYVRSTYNVTPIMWDDMLRQLYYHDLKPLGSLVQPMVWSYAEQVEQYISDLTWHRYATVFQSPIWAASAFKGASGETALVPEIGRHINNNLGEPDKVSQKGLQGNFHEYS